MSKHPSDLLQVRVCLGTNVFGLVSLKLYITPPGWCTCWGSPPLFSTRSLSLIGTPNDHALLPLLIRTNFCLCGGQETSRVRGPLCQNFFESHASCLQGKLVSTAHHPAMCHVLCLYDICFVGCGMELPVDNHAPTRGTYGCTQIPYHTMISWKQSMDLQ